MPSQSFVSFKGLEGGFRTPRRLFFKKRSLELNFVIVLTTYLLYEIYCTRTRSLGGRQLTNEIYVVHVHVQYNVVVSGVSNK